MIEITAKTAPEPSEPRDSDEQVAQKGPAKKPKDRSTDDEGKDLENPT